MTILYKSTHLILKENSKGSPKAYTGCKALRSLKN